MPLQVAMCVCAPVSVWLAVSAFSCVCSDNSGRADELIKKLSLSCFSRNIISQLLLLYQDGAAAFALRVLATNYKQSDILAFESERERERYIYGPTGFVNAWKFPTRGLNWFILFRGSRGRGDWSFKCALNNTLQHRIRSPVISSFFLHVLFYGVRLG